MRFFSNDKDSRDDQQGVDVQERAEQVNPDQAHDEHPERVASEPVSVPQQRPSSPWSSGPDSGDAAGAGRPEFHEPAPGDGVVADDGVRVAGRRGNDVVDVALDDQGGFDDPQVRDADTTTREDTTPPDARFAADGTVTGGGDSSSSGATGTAAGGALAGATSANAVADRADDSRGDDRRDPALKDDGTFDSPQAVDPDTDRPLDSAAQSAPVAVPVAGAAPTGTATPTAGTAGSLFDADDAGSFKERWRDVQLRFVDSPKEATAEAAGLLDEAVDRLAASLRAQKGRLAGDGTEDTEKLRVELRGYRDMLNRILDL